MNLEKKELSLKSRWKHFFVSLLSFILLPLIPLLAVLITKNGVIDIKEWYYVTFCFVINIAISSKDGVLFISKVILAVLLINVYYNLDFNLVSVIDIVFLNIYESKYYWSDDLCGW